MKPRLEEFACAKTSERTYQPKLIRTSDVIKYPTVIIILLYA
jgi:hypothetical protein